jgi:DNA-binding MarR family transcriptional regulator
VLEENAEVPGATPPAALTRYVGYLLRRVHARFAVGTRDAQEFFVLDALSHGDVHVQRTLANRLDINRTTMVQLVDGLVRAGFVTRGQNPENRRSHILSITPAGRDELAAQRAELSTRDAQLTAALSPSARTRLRELLRRLAPEAGDWPTEHLVAHAHQLLWKLGDSDPELVAAGLRIRHFGALSAIHQLGPCPQQVLARHLAITEPAAAEMVDPLVKAGLVARGQDPADRRRYALELTPLGRERLEVVRGAVNRLDARITELLGSADAAAELRELLVRLLPPSAPPAEPGAYAGPT